MEKREAIVAIFNFAKKKLKVKLKKTGAATFREMANPASAAAAAVIELSSKNVQFCEICDPFCSCFCLLQALTCLGKENCGIRE